MSMAIFAAPLALLAAVGAAIGIAISAKAGAESIARQPDKASEIRSLSFLGMVLCEACAIYGLLIALLIVILQ